MIMLIYNQKETKRTKQRTDKEIIKMTNKEKFGKQIVDIVCNGNGFAVDKYSGMVVPCDCIACSNCLFNDCRNCNEGRKNGRSQNM